MYTRFSTLLVAALVAVAAAAPSALQAHDEDPKCDSGVMQCCASTETLTPARLDELRGQLGLPLPDIDGVIGLNCTPIPAIGTGSGAKCTQKPVCCTDNDFNGVINLDCAPLDLN